MRYSETLKPKGLFKNGHCSTIYPALFRSISVSFERQRIITLDSDFFDVDVLDNNTSKTVVLLHGLEGSTSSSYIKGMASSLGANGFNVHAINFRSCSGIPNNRLQSYHSGFTSDLRHYIALLKESNSQQQIYLCGFSLGGNVVLKYLAEEHLNTQHVVRAIAVSSPVDLKGSAWKLTERGNRIYMNRFLKSLKNKIKHKATAYGLDTDGIDTIETFKEFDDRYTAPIHGFNNALEYWQKCSSLFLLNQIRIPTLILSAKNDPFLSATCFPSAQDIGNPNLTMEYPAYGGHVGFYKGFFTRKYWSELRAIQFFNSF